MNVGARILWGIVAGVLAALIAKFLGFEGTVSRAATVAVVFIIVFGGLAWRDKSKSTTARSDEARS